MDHLYYPNGSRPLPIEIPFLCRVPFHEISFYDFTPKQSLLQLPQQPVEEAACFLQTWLYFGILSELLKLQDYPAERLGSFVRLKTGSGQTILSSHDLPEFCRIWAKDCRKSAVMGWPSNQSKAVCKLLTEALEVTEYLDDLMVIGGDDGDPLKNVVGTTLGAVKFLIEYILDALRFMNTVQPNNLTEKAASHHRIVNYNQLKAAGFPFKRPSIPQFLLSYMQKQGWCPSEINRIGVESSLAGIYYKALLPGLSNLNPMHKWCGQDSCSARRYLTAACYPPHYACTGCNQASVKTSEIMAMYEKGIIPVIAINKRQDGYIDLKIEGVGKGTRFIAVSHVSSDGVGNPMMNGLHECQLRQLVQDLDRLRDTSFEFSSDKTLRFWMDTFCVPRRGNVSSIAIRASRSVALSYIDAIYSLAEVVMVRDSSLMRLNHQAMPREQMFAHISCSPWSSSCWNLLEAAMAYKVKIQFADGFCDLDREYRQLNNWRANRLSDGFNKPSQLPKHQEYLLKASLSSFYAAIPSRNPLRESTTGDLHGKSRMKTREILSYAQTGYVYNDYADLWNFTQAWNALLYRKTATDADLQQILCNIFRFKIWDITSLSDEHARSKHFAMKLLLNDQKSYLPLSLLFNNQSRIDENMNRWAPIKVADRKIDLEVGLMKRERGGLKLYPGRERSLRGVIFKNAALTQRRAYLIVRVDKRKQWLRLYVELDEDIPAFARQFNMGCILLDPASDYDTSRIGFKLRGAYVCTSNHAADSIQARYICAVGISSSSEAGSALPTIEGAMTNPSQDFTLDCGKNARLSTCFPSSLPSSSVLLIPPTLTNTSLQPRYVGLANSKISLNTLWPPHL